MIAGTVCQNGGVEHFATGAAFPRIECSDEVVEFLGVHSSFAFRTFHGLFPFAELSDMPQFLASDIQQTIHLSCHIGRENRGRLQADRRGNGFLCKNKMLPVK
jgi:hypothetical protein